MIDLEQYNFENSTIIAPRGMWDVFFQYRRRHPEVDFKLLSIEELDRFFSYQYDERALLFLLERKIPYNLAVDMISSMTHLEDKTYHSQKLNDLNELRKKLCQSYLLFMDAYPEREFKDKNVFVAGYKNLTRVKKLLGDIPFTYLDLYEIKEGSPVVETLDDCFSEFHHLFNLIARDIESGTPVDDICLLGMKDEYATLLSLFSDAYGIPVEFSASRKLIEEAIATYFLKEFKKGIETKTIFDSLRKVYPDSPYITDMDLLVQRFKIENYTLEEQYKLYTDLFFATSLKNRKKSNCVHVLKSYFPPLNAHVYIVDFNLGNLPPSSSDASYLNDKEKEEIGIETSKDVFIKNRDELKALLQSKNVISILSIQVGIDGKPRYASPLANDTSILKKRAEPLAFEYSKAFSKMWLASINDNFRKYRKLSPYRNTLKLAIPDFERYSCSYQGYSRFDESSFLKLSYSSVSEYFTCPFKYLCNHVARIDDSETLFSARIGTLCHQVLEHRYHNGKPDANFDFNQEWEKAVIDITTGEYGSPLSPKEEILLIRIKEILKDTINFIDSHEAFHDNPTYFTEYQADINIDEKTKLVGKIDKAILTGQKERYLSIIDYKTGNAKYQEKLLPYGISLQLPLYSFIAKNVSDFASAEPIGLYISPILPDNEEDFENQAKLKGIFLEEVDKIRTFEPNFEKSSYIKSMAYSSKNQSFSYTSHKPESYFDEIASIAEKKLLEASDGIRNNDFRIHPLVYQQNPPCQNCPFGDVCYVRKENFWYVKKEDFEAEEGGEENA